MDAGIYLKDVRHHQKELVYLWKYVPIINKYGQDDIRIYYKPDENIGSGVEIYVLEFMSRSSEELWDPETMRVLTIYKASCYFDGLRHLYMNPDEEDHEGYLYYVDLQLHIKIYQEMQKLIEKYCRDRD